MKLNIEINEKWKNIETKGFNTVPVYSIQQ